MSGVLSGLIGAFAFVASPGFDSISTLSGNNSATSLTFSSIPNTYKSLQIRYLGNDGNLTQLILQINGDTGANYTRHNLLGDGSAVSSSGTINQTSITLGNTANSEPSAGIVDIHDYASSTKNKTIRGINGTAQTYGNIWLISGLWLNTSAITSLTIKRSDSGVISSTSKFALYGVK